VTWRQGHLVNLRNVPSTHNHATVIRILFKGINDIRKLIYTICIRTRITNTVMSIISLSPMSPLESIPRSNFTFWIV
jgi:hypothetical protein